MVLAITITSTYHAVILVHAVLVEGNPVYFIVASASLPIGGLVVNSIDWQWVDLLAQGDL